MPLVRCPGCELRLEESDTRKQVSHTERCHPEIWMRRLEANGYTDDEIVGQIALILTKHPDLLTLLDEIEHMGCYIEIQTKKDDHHVTIFRGDKGYCAYSTHSILASLNLAYDRMEHDPDKPTNWCPLCKGQSKDNTCPKCGA